MNPLAKPLRYLIGVDEVGPGKIGEIIEVGYDVDTPPPVGLAIKYCNLFDEKNTGEYGPYLSDSDTAQQYNEGQIDPNFKGWTKNLTEQLTRARNGGFKYVELDNPDAYKLVHFMQAVALAETYGLGVIAKNPGLDYDGDDATQAVAHPNVFGIIVERGAGRPSDMHAMRVAAGKSDLPVWFVAFGSGRGWANDMAAEAKSYVNMWVSYSSAGEYGSSIDVGTTKTLPSPFEPGAIIPQIGNNMADVVPPWLATMRSIKGTDEFAGGADNPIIMSWRDFISRTYPEMAAYCRNYTHDSVPWCGLAMAYVMAVNGIRPVFGRTDTDKFLWADAWRQLGSKLAKPKLGCVMVFTRDGGGHVSLYEGEEGNNYVICGGNQSNSVNVTRMSKSRFIGAFWPDQIAQTKPVHEPVQESDGPEPETVFRVSGKMSTFGGPADTGMKPDEGLALFQSPSQISDYLLPEAQAGAPGLGRRLNPEKFYLACRWPTDRYPFLRNAVAWVSANGKTVKAKPMDWGPAEWTGRVADLSPGCAKALDLDTDDVCTVTVYEDQAYDPTKAPLEPDDVFDPLPQPPLPAVSNPLLLIVLLLVLSKFKEKQMANPPTQPGLDIDALLQALLKSLAPPPPPPPPPPPAPTDLAAILQALLQQLQQGGQPILTLPAPPVVNQPPAPPVKDATATPIMQKPSVRVGIIGGLISAAATYFSGGLIPPGIGEMVTAAFAGTAVTGSTGIFGSIKNWWDGRQAAKYAASA